MTAANHQLQPHELDEALRKLVIERAMAINSQTPWPASRQ